MTKQISVFFHFLVLKHLFFFLIFMILGSKAGFLRDACKLKSEGELGNKRVY